MKPLSIAHGGKTLTVKKMEIGLPLELGDNTLSGRIDKVVAAHVEGCGVDSRLRLHLFILCTRRSGGTAHDGMGATSQFDLPSQTPRVRILLWSTKTRSSPLGCFSTLLQEVDN